MSKNLKSLFLCFFLCCSLIGCGDDEIQGVQSAPFHLDKSITYKQLFDTYKWTTGKIEWELLESDRGAKIVQAKGDYVYHLEPGFEKNLLVNPWTTPEKVDWVEVGLIPVHLIAQFAISSDGKRFDTTYIGLEIEGKTEKTNINSIYKDIKENKPIQAGWSAYELQQVYLKKNK